jgi:hypothetical protein
MGREQPRERDGAVEPQFTGEAGPDEAAAWEEVAAGRYMPRRIKGSCKGRALG